MKLPIILDGGRFRQLPTGEQLITNPNIVKVKSPQFAIATSISTPVNFTNAEIPNTAMWNGSPADKVYIPENGYYQICIFFRFDSNPTGQRSIQFKRNNISIGFWRFLGQYESPSTNIYQLTKDDYLEIELFQNSGSDLLLLFCEMTVLQIA